MTFHATNWFSFFRQILGLDEIFEVLAQNGANTMARSKSLSTPLMLASQSGNEMCVLKMVKSSTNGRSLEPSSGNIKTFGAFFKILFNFSGHEKIVEFLIRNGSDVNARDHEDSTALILAAYAGKYPNIRQFLLISVQ